MSPHRDANTASSAAGFWLWGLKMRHVCDEQLVVRISGGDLALLDRAVKQLDLTRSEFVRDTVLPAARQVLKMTKQGES